MGQVGVWQIVVVAVLIVLLFGRGKISDLMGDVAKGINSFKRGLNEEDKAVDTAKTIEQTADTTADVASARDENKTKASG